MSVSTRSRAIDPQRSSGTVQASETGATIPRRPGEQSTRRGVQNLSLTTKITNDSKVTKNKNYILFRVLRDLRAIVVAFYIAFDTRGTGTTGLSGSGVKSSPGLMNRSASNLYCLSYS